MRSCKQGHIFQLGIYNDVQVTLLHASRAKPVVTQSFQKLDSFHGNELQVVEKKLFSVFMAILLPKYNKE